METQSQFHADVERKNEVRTGVLTQVMIAKTDPNRPDLTDEELQAAKQSGQYNNLFLKLDFPKTTKFNVDPSVPQQNYSLVSFVPSQGAMPDSNGYFGLIKIRGCFATQNEAEEHADMLLRKYDSFAEIQVGRVGKYLPLLGDMTPYTMETREIDIRKQVEDIVRAETRKRKEQEAREIDEVQQRQQKLTDKTHRAEEDESVSDLDFYIRLRNKKAQNAVAIDDWNKKIAEARVTIEKTKTDIEALDRKHPEFKRQFLAKYEEALAQVGAEASKNPLIAYMKADAEEEQKEEQNDSCTSIDTTAVDTQCSSSSSS